MKEYKKHITTILVLVITLGVFNFSFCTNEDWSGQAIADFIYNEIDAPDVLKDERYGRYITREEFAQLIVASYCKIKGIPKTDVTLSDNPFLDTNSEDVVRAYQLGIVVGSGDNQYNPEDYITREETAIMIVRLLSILSINTNYDEKNIEQFKDSKVISPWAYNAISYCVQEDIMRGGNNYILPQNYTTTEQVIVMIHRLMKKYDWIESVDYKYINSMRVPSNSQIKVDSDGEEDWNIKFYWNEIDNIEKLKSDLLYMLHSKFDDMTEEELTRAINSIVSTKDNINDTKDVYEFTLSSSYNYRVIVITYKNRVSIILTKY